MSGIFLLFVFLLWLAIAISLSKFVTNKLPETKWPGHVRLIVFAILLPLPVIDEIVGGSQFRKLCQENSVIEVDRATAEGKTVYLVKSQDTEIRGKWVRILAKPWRYADIKTNDVVVEYRTLTASGGWFVRLLGVSERMPLLFNGSCAPDTRPASIEAFKKLGIEYVERSTVIKGESN